MRYSSKLGTLSAVAFAPSPDPRLARFCGLPGEIVTEAVEAALPVGAALGDPAPPPAERARLDAARAHPPNLLGADEAARLQHLQVLHNRRQRHWQRSRELAHRRRAAAEA